MVSVNEARKSIEDNIKPLSVRNMLLSEAFGYVLSQDMYASVDVPAFAQSAMDGYAFNYENYSRGMALNILGEVSAGDSPKNIVEVGSAVRIFTGAQVPSGFDTVVMQEKTTVNSGVLFIDDDQLVKGSNVRLQGSEIAKGNKVLEQGTYLSAACIGLLASLGLATVNVYSKPIVQIIITGKELIQPGFAAEPGKVYESNSYTLKAALATLHIENVTVQYVTDELDPLVTALHEAIEKADLILLTGGISVGDYDFVKQATILCGISEVFYKVKQKPGKPLYFGKKDDKVVFGLPGNPASVLTCFYEYVTLALGLLTQRRNVVKSTRMPLLQEYVKKKGLTFFLKGSCRENNVSILSAQESYRLSSFSTADCLIVLDEDRDQYAAGEIVEVHLLP